MVKQCRGAIDLTKISPLTYIYIYIYIYNFFIQSSPSTIRYANFYLVTGLWYVDNKTVGDLHKIIWLSSLEVGIFAAKWPTSSSQQKKKKKTTKKKTKNVAQFENYNIDSVTLDILFPNPFKLKGSIKGVSDLIKIIIGQFGQLFNILGLMLSH